MPNNSVNTNVGALVALQNLNVTNRELATTQTRVNTGLRVASAKDNGAIWAIAQNQRATSQSLNAVKESLQRGQSSVDVAISAGESISDLLLQMKEKALASADAGLDTTSRQALADEFISLRQQISKAVINADFNGSNLIKQAGTTVKALANADASSVITVVAQTLALADEFISLRQQITKAVINADFNGTNLIKQAGTTIKALANSDASSVITVVAQTLTLTALSINASTIGTKTLASTAITALNAAISEVSSKLSQLGTGAKALASHFNFISKLQDTIDAGVGNLVDADLAKESAKLQALQTKQQLGIQALTIANQAPQVLLSLFR